MPLTADPSKYLKIRREGPNKQKHPHPCHVSVKVKTRNHKQGQGAEISCEENL